MQTEDTTSVLPVVQLNVHRTVTRKTQPCLKDSTLESKKLSACKNILLPSKKCLNPLLGAPYRDSMKQQSLLDEQKSNKSMLKQRIMSAKMLRFKELQNQLADAHYHLNELANENRLLKALQKRQDSALRRYEGTNAELPRLINSHHEELRVLQTKYKKLKELHKDTCNMLREKENELYSVNSQNKHLLQLSKDRNLEEREKLQLQLSDMNYKMQQQQKTIQVLHRKLTLETKSLKHQLHVEISKHKETQKNLQETIEKLKNLECLLDNREKRLYYNGQLPIYNKEKNLGSHSLTNLRDVSISNPIKASSRSKKSENGMPKDNLPSLDILESNDDEKVTRLTNNVNRNHSVDQLKSETMANLQQIRKFRLQRSPHMRKTAHSMDDLRLRSRDLETRAHDDEKVKSTDYTAILERDELNNQNESGKLRKLFNRLKNQNSQKLQKELNPDFDYSSEDGESENDASEYYIQSYDTPQKSRELYARLINSTDTSDTLDDIMKKARDYSDDEEKEEEAAELNTHLVEDLMFQKDKYKSKLKILRYRDNDLYNSGSDVDSDGKIYTNGDFSIEYKSNGLQTNLPKYMEEQIGAAHSEYNTLDVAERSARRSKGVQQRISDNAQNDVNVGSTDVSQQFSNKISLDKEQLLASKEVDNAFTNIKKEDCTKEEETKYLEDQSMCVDISRDKFYCDINNTSEKMETLTSSENKKIEKNSQQVYEKDESSQPMDNMEKEYFQSEAKEMSSVMYRDEQMSNKNDVNTGTQNKSNASLENVDESPNNVIRQTEQDNGIKSEAKELKQATSDKKKINYNKEKLLATMKAIDDNENIEFLSQGFKNHNVSRMQIMENLHRGLPAHSKPKRDIIRDIFEDNHIESKVRSTCSKSH
ncbi:putative leucine-rich repeat-containing protein DDB_G0290503 [Monomorium pharaonis]|uniref:putative leucine-rich repeat-containing protein DDB_G0290503 n=1 Tax=Monomorium pharaonis TaxID=307658 RepID=UPI00063FBD3F|nr:putative leucine-rich repeat-containing protein DDB_G0290503 [Monomorium pharaonis]